MEEERLVKIRDVLKELPSPHYRSLHCHYVRLSVFMQISVIMSLFSIRTLEYLMYHLVKMASFSSETNMHARNLAIVWAPNLLRFLRYSYTVYLLFLHYRI